MAVHVSLGFAQLKDKNLLPFNAGVVTGLMILPNTWPPTVGTGSGFAVSVPA
jgi:hypothetical protein